METFRNADKRIKVFSLINTLVLLAAVLILPQLNPYLMLIGVSLQLLSYFLFLFYATRQYAQFTSQIWLPKTSFSTRSYHLTRHLLLPLVQLSSFWLAVFFIRDLWVVLLLSAIEAYLFFYLAININAFFERDNREELQTHFIYDVLSLVSVFFCNYAIFGAARYWELTQPWPVIASALLMFCYLVAETLRYRSQNAWLIQSFFMLLFLVILALLYAAVLSELQTVVLLVLSSYLHLNILHHLRSASGLNWRVWVEYLLMFAIAATVLVPVLG